MIARRLHAWTALAALLAALLTPNAPAAAAPTLRPHELTCDAGRALTEEASSGLPLLVGQCDVAAGPQAAAPLGGSAPEAPGPADCAIPGLDDHCEAWSAPRYDGPWGGDDYAGYGGVGRHTTVLAHPTEDLVFVGGTSTRGSGAAFDADFVEIAYRASTGQPVWTAGLEGIDALTLAYQSSIALSPDGSTLYAVGDVAEPGVYEYRTAVAAFDALTGARRWARTYSFGISSIQSALSPLAVGHVERLYTAGTGNVAPPGGVPRAGGTVAAIDPADGEVVWTSAFVGASSSGNRFNELALSPDGATIYAGGGEHRSDGLAMNFTAAAFRATDGAILWSSRDTLSQPDGFYGINGVTDMKITPDGSRLLLSGMDPIASSSILGDSSSAIVTVAHHTSNGDVAWRQSYGGPVAGETHFYFTLFQGMLALSPDGRTAVVTAAINSASGTGTVAYDVETGTQKWGIESEEPQHAYTFNNFIGYYPTVHVTGDRAYLSNRRGYGVSQYHTTTMAYGLDDGGLDWTARLGTNRALFTGSGLAPDGRRLFVTAADQLLSASSATPDADTVDIVTVAYDT